jgi:hypothetical protein
MGVGTGRLYHLPALEEFTTSTGRQLHLAYPAYTIQARQPDMTSNGTYAGPQGWGKEVAVTDPNSIQNTSKRSKYMTTRSRN